MHDAVSAVLAHSQNKKRNFIETIEIQIGLKNYDPARDKRIGGSIKLPEVPKAKLSVCVLGDQAHCNEAKEAGIDFLSEEDLSKFNRNKKLVKKLAAKYDVFLSSSSLIKKIPRLLGPGLSKSGKFPQIIPPNAELPERVKDACSSVKFQLKIKAKSPLCMNAAVAHVGMSQDDIEANIVAALNFVVSLLKKKWQNVKRLHIKSTMGPAYRIYGAPKPNENKISAEN